MLILISKILHKKTVSHKRKYNIPDGKITYSDLNVPAKALFSRKYRISGKPDYIVKIQNKNIPVEVKSGNHERPRTSHIMQLAAYCQILEDEYKEFVPYGILVYDDSNYKINFDPKMRFELESTINKMRNVIAKKEYRNHNSPARCVNCSMREHCTYKLT